MSTFLLDAATSPASSIVVKVSLLIAVAGIVQAALRRWTSAATRHIVWTFAIVGILLLPVLSFSLPRWVFGVQIEAKDADSAPIVHRVVETAGHHAVVSPPNVRSVTLEPVTSVVDRFSVSWPTAVAALYASGVFVVLIALVLHQWSARRCTRMATDVHDSEWIGLLRESANCMGVRYAVRLLRSRDRTMPMAVGTHHPAIVIPSIAETWGADRRRAVILHELAHIARRDCLTQSLAFAACAVYWFHPAVWWVARRLRIERELACDDRVIAAGTQPREYAGHLLEIAYSFGGNRMSALAVSMARRQRLETRLLAALDSARNRAIPARRAFVSGAALAATCVVALAVATPTPVAARGDVDRTPLTLQPTAEQSSEAARPIMRLLTDLRSATWSFARSVADAIGVPQDNLPGTWEMRPTEKTGVVHLRLAELNSSSGSNVPIDQFEGLTAAQLTGPGGPIQFRLRRDAGTFSFEGVLRNGVAAGTFSFTPDPSFTAELAKRGFARPTAREQYQLARHDIGFAFVDELNKQGYSKPETSGLVRAGEHGVQVTYLREMGMLGYRLGSLDSLITLRDHGITPDYVRELAGLGYTGLATDDLRRARDHGITPDYVRGMRDAGYGSLPMEDLITTRDHGITPEFVRELGDAGYRKVPLEQLIRVRDHGVVPEYVRAMRQLGFAAPLDDLVRVRDHGVTADFVRDMSALGYTGLTLDTLVRIRDHGVTPDYARDLMTLGYDRLTVDDLVTLRDHGLTVDRIRAANARAGTRLPIDMLKSLAAGGMR
jgi:beta-lactamase regulating signal transducer with metallopeptidase domain